MKPVGSSPQPPAAFLAKDTVVVIDPEAMEVLTPEAGR